MIELVGKLPGKCLMTDVHKQPCIIISTMSALKYDVGDHTVVNVSRLLVQCGKPGKHCQYRCLNLTK